MQVVLSLGLLRLSNYQFLNYKINIKLDSLDEINFPKAKDFAPFELINEFKVDTNYLDKKFIISKHVNINLLPIKLFISSRIFLNYE